MKWFFYALLICGLSACQAEIPTQSADLKTYLMTHPDYLRKEMLACNVKPDGDRCAVVAAAANEMRSLIEDCQRDPQGFGNRILKAQIKLAQTGQGADEVKILITIIAFTGQE